MVLTRQKVRSGANLESPQRTQPEINIRELRTPSLKVFTQEQNELFVQQVFNTLMKRRVKICIIAFLV